METICIIFRDFGTLKEYFDIKRMLNLLKLENWRNIPPFSHFLMPLFNSIEVVRKELRDMNDEGILRCKYILENKSYP